MKFVKPLDCIRCLYTDYWWWIKFFLFKKKCNPPFQWIAETVREILAHVPAGVRSEAPTSGSSELRELDGEAGLTPLHLAAYSGDENVVRLLLNSPGVSVDQPSTQNVSPVDIRI